MYVPPPASTVFWMPGSSCAAQRGCWKLFHDTPTVQPLRRRHCRGTGRRVAAAAAAGVLPLPMPPPWVRSSPRCSNRLRRNRGRRGQQRRQFPDSAFCDHPPLTCPSRSTDAGAARLHPPRSAAHRWRIGAVSRLRSCAGRFRARVARMPVRASQPAGSARSGSKRKLGGAEERRVDAERRRDDADQPARRGQRASRPVRRSIASTDERMNPAEAARRGR